MGDVAVSKVDVTVNIRLKRYREIFSRSDGC